jgi:serine/threonine-protein kinase RsbW
MVGAALERAGVTPECVHDVKVAVSEACTNAYEHAAAGEAYEVQITLDDEFLAIDVIDQGPGLTPVKPPSAADHPGLVAEDGRGIEIIRALTEHAAFDTVSGEGAAVRMWKRLQWKSQAPWTNPPDKNPAGPDIA